MGALQTLDMCWLVSSSDPTLKFADLCELMSGFPQADIGLGQKHIRSAISHTGR